MKLSFRYVRRPATLLSLSVAVLLHAAPAPSPISFELKKIAFRLENSETPARNAPETMPGGVAIFDYNGDGRPDIFFTNGANIATLNKELNAGLADSRVKARIVELGGTVTGGSPAEFGTVLSEAVQKWAKVIKFAGIRAD